MTTSFVHRSARTSTVLSIALGFLSIPALSLGQSQDATFAAPAGEPFVPGEIIVKMKPGATGLADPSAAAALGVERARPALTSGGEILFRLESAPAAGMAAPATVARTREETIQAVEEIRDRPDVEYAEPNYLMFPLANANDPRFPEQWDYRVLGNGAGQSPGGIGATELWDTTKGSLDVVVAVIDTGILSDHPDIAGSANQAGGVDMISHTGVSNDGDARDDDPVDPGDAVAADECKRLFGLPSHPARLPSWHGTHVAGTVGVGGTNNGKSVAGTNWHVKVLSVRTLGKCGGTLSDIADAIRWAAGMPVPGMTTNPTPARVINLSLGALGTCSPVYQRAIDDVNARGAIVVVAAGNDGIDAAGAQPASCRDVTTVGASTDQGRLATDFSNFGSTVDIIAPGAAILSLVKGGERLMWGTSMAAPHVTGVIALWLSQHPDWSREQVEQALRQNAVPRNASHACPPDHCGAGLLSAKLAATPPEASPASLALSPGQVELDDNSRERTLAATVRRGAQPLAGQTVTFAVADADVAAVLPSSGTTNGAGEATVLVRAQDSGKTTITARSGAATASVPVKVPSGSTTTAALALLGIGAVEWWRRRARR